MSNRRDRFYKVLHLVIDQLVDLETKHLRSKRPEEIAAHFGIKLPTRYSSTEVCPECHLDTVVFVRTLMSKRCMNCFWPVAMRSGASAPEWDPNAPVVKARGNRERDVFAKPVYVEEPVPSEITPLRQGVRIDTHKVDVSKPDTRGMVGEWQ